MFKGNKSFFILLVIIIISLFGISVNKVFASSVIVGATNPIPGHEHTNVQAKNMLLVWGENVSQYNPGCAPISGYDVYIGPSSALLNKITDSLKENFINIGDLNYNEVRYWRVDIHDKCGNVSQGPVWYFVTGGPEIPSRPDNLKTQIFGDDIKLTWTESNNPSGFYFGYDIERREDGGDYKWIRSVAGSESIDENVSTGVKYYYKVKATNQSGSSDYSNEVNVIISKDRKEIPKLSIEPAYIFLNKTSKILFKGTVSNATPSAKVLFYLKRPDVSLKENGTEAGATNNNGYLSVNTNQEIVFGNTGIYEGWVVVNGKTSNVVKVQIVNPWSETSTNNAINQINSRASDLVQNKIDPILAELKSLRNTVKEQQNKIKYLKMLIKGVKGISENAQDAINNFITYGVDDNTKKLGEGERAAVMNSFKAAYNKLPETDEELADAIKIANGRWPSITNDEAEKKAKEQFIKIYKRIADMDKPSDNAAIKVMAYGLRQKAQNRNLNSEKSGINTFRKIYGYQPKSTEDWNTMQAITYSGAKRIADTDKDLLSDELEEKLGTDSNNPDTDNDGHKDGAEVNGGYDPKGM